MFKILIIHENKNNRKIRNFGKNCTKLPNLVIRDLPSFNDDVITFELWKLILLSENIN
jgi:hypothetical protein